MGLADLETVTQYVADLRNLLNDSTLTAFIKSFISEVRVTGIEVPGVKTDDVQRQFMRARHNSRWRFMGRFLMLYLSWSVLPPHKIQWACRVFQFTGDKR